jgi:hypothetical protein
MILDWAFDGFPGQVKAGKQATHKYNPNQRSIDESWDEIPFGESGHDRPEQSRTGKPPQTGAEARGRPDEYQALKNISTEDENRLDEGKHCGSERNCLDSASPP